MQMVGQASSGTWLTSHSLLSMSFTPAKVVGKRSRFYRLVHRMLNWVHKRQQYGGKKNLLVIAKAMPGEDNINLISFLDEMIDRYHNVFTVVPDGCCLPENFDYPEPILAWEWLALCYGRESIDLSSAYPTDDDDDDSGSSSQGVKRASETDAAGSAKKRLQKEADSQN
ncbi:BnaUnng04730D [Brassica napus]|uniref:BnaUnng04730D protein n=1 Tax=Brassica napus TaxID=3708 RepID=A0A078JZ12_BRANA|nr:BnaUnng04730D [Brassica napus]